MNDTIDYDALRERLARMACDLRGLNPEHVAAGQDRPAWRSEAIQSDVERSLKILQGCG